MSPLSRAERLLVAASLLLFLFFAAAWIHLPGPQHDELLHLPVLSPLLRQYAEFSVKFHGRDLPLMIMSYVGAWKGWLLWLWFRIIPMGVPGYRAFGIALGVATVWLIFRLVRRYYGPPIALLTTGLVATDPSFIHTIRLDYGPVAVMQFLKIGGLALLSRWLSTGSGPALAGSMFVFGLGLWDKATFVWFLAGLGATLVLLYPRQVQERLRAKPGALVLGIAALLLGAAPLIAYNLTRSGQTWRERGRFEVRWFKLLEAQGTFTGIFMQSLTGEDQLEYAPPAHDIAFPRLSDWMYRMGWRRETILLPLLALSLIALPFNLWMSRPRRRLLFPLLLSLLTYACMFFTFEGGASVHHVIMLQPFPMLFLAVSLWTPAERWPRLVPRAAAVLIAAGAAAVNLSVNARHLAIYTRTGGSGGFTDAVYRLVPYLAQHPGWKLYAIDWGFSHPVAFLSERWKLQVDDFFFQILEPQDPGFARNVARLEELMRDPNNVFLLHSPQRTLSPVPAQEFFALVGRGAEMRRIAFFQERSGEMIYEIYQRGSPSSRGSSGPEIQVEFMPDRVAPQQEYVIQVRELAISWIDLVYHVDRASSGTVTRFCRLDAEGRARVTVPASHPAATVRITLIRSSGGEWRPARGAITVTKP